MNNTALAQQPEKLPRLIEHAASALARATSAGEVLEAKAEAAAIYDAAKVAARFAKAKQAHDTIIAACHKAQADALLIEMRAQMRLADEYDAAQARGELAKHSSGNPQIVPNKNDLPKTAAEVGLDRKEIHEARRVRDAEKAKPGIVEETLAATGEPTRARLKRAVDEVLEPPRPTVQAEAIARAKEEEDEPEPLPAGYRCDCPMCEGIVTVNFGKPMRDPKDLDTLRQFAAFIMVNLHDGMLTLTGDPKRMNRFRELAERINLLIPMTARYTEKGERT